MLFRSAGVDFPEEEGVSPEESRFAGLLRGFLALSSPRESFPRGLPRRSHLGLSGILIPVRTGPMADRSMGTLVPTGPTAALPDARLLARAARVSAIARRSLKTVDAPQPPTSRANCRRVAPTKQGVVKLPERVMTPERRVWQLQCR